MVIHILDPINKVNDGKNHMHIYNWIEMCEGVVGLPNIFKQSSFLVSNEHVQPMCVLKQYYYLNK